MTDTALDHMLEARRTLQFQHDNSSWESGSKYRAKIAEADKQIAELKALPVEVQNLTYRQYSLLTALASTAGQTPAKVAADMTRNGRDLGAAINAAAHTLMHSTAYAG